MSLDRLVLWRHGETGHNLAGRIQGQLDTELTGTGHRQARRAAPVVAGFAPAVALSSDLRRATATAATLTEVSGTAVRLDKRLRETCVGEWQGLNGAEVEHGWPGAMAEWRSSPTWAPPGGESRSEVGLLRRRLGFFHQLVMCGPSRRESGMNERGRRRAAVCTAQGWSTSLGRGPRGPEGRGKLSAARAASQCDSRERMMRLSR